MILDLPETVWHMMTDELKDYWLNKQHVQIRTFDLTVTRKGIERIKETFIN